MTRKLKPREINHLQKHGIDPFDINDNRPVEYITGFAEFFGRDFIVNDDVLIPRPETERIIDIALNHIDRKIKCHAEPVEASTFSSSKQTHYFINFADVGCGNGAIGITFAKEFEKRNIDYSGILSDVSEKALQVAKSNIEAGRPFLPAGRSRRLQLIQSNLLSNYPKSHKFDIIFANLPYIPSSRVHNLDSSVKDFEPHLALDGGEDGLTLIRQLLHQAKSYLKNYGIIILEVDDTHTDASAFGNDYEIEILKDENKKNRFWILKNKNIL